MGSTPRYYMYYSEFIRWIMELPHKLILATFIDGVKCNSINSKKPKEAKSYKVQVISFEGESGSE